jgi:hypothetical protein
MKNPTNSAKDEAARGAGPHSEKVVIRKLPSGARGLDEILGGGIRSSRSISSRVRRAAGKQLSRTRSSSRTQRPRSQRSISPCWVSRR